MRERESFAGPGFERQLIVAAPIFFLYSSTGYVPRIRVPPVRTPLRAAHEHVKKGVSPVSVI